MSNYKPLGTEIAKEIFYRSVRENRKILVYYDADIDGAISGMLVTKELQYRGIQSEYYVNKNRKHGFLLENLEKYRGYLIIAVDFSITFNKLEEIQKCGINLINIDHHEIAYKEIYHKREQDTEIVIINNHYEFEDKRYSFLSGAGVVYNVLNNWRENYASVDKKALVGWSLLSDICPIETELAKEYLDNTYSWNTEYGNRLLKISKKTVEYGFGESKIDRQYIDFNLSPKINALFRLNQGDYAIQLLRGDIEPQLSLDMIVKIQREWIKKFNECVTCKEYSNLIIGEINLDLFTQPIGYDLTNFIGVSASHMVDKTGKTVIYIGKYKDGRMRGSLRGYKDGVDYLKILSDFGYKCAGHKMAFGITKISEEKIDYDYLNYVIKIAEDKVKSIDRVIKVSNLNMYKSYRPEKIATYNEYVRASHKKLIQYTGLNTWVMKDKGKLQHYIIDGQSVYGFDKDITPQTGYIEPTFVKGYMTFYLVSKSW